ncbi:hypothetical protein V7S77_08935 [Aquirufa ecclesiirivi]
MILLSEARSHCEYLNESIKEARNKLWILTSITISIIGFLLAKLSGHQIKIEEKTLFYISIPFLIFNIVYISIGMMPTKKEDLHPFLKKNGIGLRLGEGGDFQHQSSFEALIFV